jgi:hypothetical protein
VTLASTPTRQAADTAAFDAAKAARAARFGIPIKPTVKPDDSVKPKGGKGGKGGGKAAEIVRCPDPDPNPNPNPNPNRDRALPR